jgi:hypothetical protein
MLGGMEENPKVGDSSQAKLARLQFGLLSNEDTISYKFQQLFLFALLFIVMTFLVRECYGSPKKQEF